MLFRPIPFLARLDCGTLAAPNRGLPWTTDATVATELRYGCAKSGSKRLLKAVEDLRHEIPVLAFDVPADAEYGGIRSELEVAGEPIGSNDLLIAAHAYTLPRTAAPDAAFTLALTSAHTASTIVTANTDEFNRIRGLHVENWLT